MRIKVWPQRWWENYKSWIQSCIFFIVLPLKSNWEIIFSFHVPCFLICLYFWSLVHNLIFSNFNGWIRSAIPGKCPSPLQFLQWPMWLLNSVFWIIGFISFDAWGKKAVGGSKKCFWCLDVHFSCCCNMIH